MSSFRESRDELTGALNRTALFSYLSDRVKDNANLSLICANIDNMKHFNMHNGHRAGDDLLKRFVTIVKPLLGDNHALFRYGGDSFAIVLLNISQKEVLSLAQEICDISRQKLSPPQLVDCGDPHCMGHAKISVSIGVAESSPGMTSESIVQCAEKYLLKAKLAGRDRVCA